MDTEASGTNDDILFTLDGMVTNFHQRFKLFVSALKSHLTSAARINAEQLFVSVMPLLSYKFPDPKKFPFAINNGDTSLKTELTTLKAELSKLEQNQKKLEEKMATLDIEAHNYRESGKKNIGSVVAKLQDVNDEVSSIKIENKSRLDELSKVVESNENHVKGLRKLQHLLQLKNQAAPPTASIATNINAAAKPKVLKALRHRKQFSAVVDGDKDTPVITDAKLLSDELLVVADARHWCLKLFDTHGKYNCSRTCSSAPYRLARIVTSWDFSDVYIHTMALTRPNSNSIDLFEVTRYEIKLKTTLEMQASYEAIATVDQHTLAVGYGSLSQTGIDLINLNGQVLYQISPFIEPFYMDCADGLDLMCSTPDDEKVLIVNVLTGRILTDITVPQLMKPSGVTNSSCGSLLIADGMNRTLHLAFARADWAKTIWTHPQGGDQDDQLSSVSVYNGVCICATERGSLFVLDDMP